MFMFFHGGGWVLGDFPTHERFVRDLVVDSGYPAVFVNYTPSPEARYPTAINQAYAATKRVAENGDAINVDGKTLAILVEINRAQGLRGEVLRGPCRPGDRGCGRTMPDSAAEARSPR